jgi:hypothetical protein
MNKKQIILPTKKFANAPDESLDVRINLDENQTLLREGDKNIILDIAELYAKERNESIKYKIYGKLKMIFRNMYSGNTDYTYLKDRLYLVGDGSTSNWTGFLPYNEFAFLRTDVLRQSTVLSSGTTPSFNGTVVLTGYTGHTTITPMSAPYQNWNIYLSYVYSGDTNYPMKYTLSGGTSYDFVANDGIPFRVTTGTTYHTLTSPVEHGFSKGEYITLYGGYFTGNVTGRTFYVDEIGSEYYDSEKYVIKILTNQFNSGTTFPSVVFGKRCLDIRNITGSSSNYYVHLHKTLTDSNDYILDKVGFESPIWEDERKLLLENFSGLNDFLVERNRMESLIYDFKEPFYLTGITNNLGYTPTEVYVSIFLKNGNGYFEFPPKAGFKFNFHDTWIDNHFSGTTKTNKPFEVSMGTGGTFTRSSVTFTSGNTISIGTSGFTGAFAEYNNVEMKERIISESFHKFYSPTTIFDYGQTGTTTSFSGATTSNPFGLYYQPHYRIKLRQLSPYIETSKTDDVINLPENTKYFEEEGLWKWRDLYEHGFIDPDGYGTNFPFVNGIHYIKNDINFYLRNEKIYTNKQDGIKKFKIIKC